jgi:hypothetical protein
MMPTPIARPITIEAPTPLASTGIMPQYRPRTSPTEGALSPSRTSDQLAHINDSGRITTVLFVKTLMWARASERLGGWRFDGLFVPPPRGCPGVGNCLRRSLTYHVLNHGWR